MALRRIVGGFVHDSAMGVEQQWMRLETVLEHYGRLGTLLDLSTNPLAFLNSVWEVQTTTGPWIIKQHPIGTSRDRLVWIGRLLETVADLGVPVDGYLATESGEYSICLDGRRYTVAPRLPGRSYSGGVGALAPQQVKEAMRALAAFHAAALSAWTTLANPTHSAAGLGPPPAAPPAVQPLLLRPELSDMVESSPLLGHLPESRQTVLWAADMIRTWLQSDSWARLPRYVLHGDYRHKNLLLTDDAVTGIIDWDTIDEGSRLIDICGRFAQYSLEVESTNNRAHSAVSLTELLGTYDETATKIGIPLHDGELSAVGPMLLAAAVQTGLAVAHFILDEPLMENETQTQRMAEAHRRWNMSWRMIQWMREQPLLADAEA